MNTTAVICAAALGFLLFGLGMGVSAMRGKYNLLIGTQAEASHPLNRWVRAHANTAEYVPFLAVLFLWLGSHSPATWVVWTMVIATVCRFALVVGLLTCGPLTRPNPVRFLGALGTYLCGVALCVALLPGVA